MSTRIIDPAGDFHLLVTSTTIIISRRILEAHSAHELHCNILHSATHHLILHDINIVALETILRILHGVPDIDYNLSHNNTHTTPTPKTFDQESILTLYHILNLSIQHFKTKHLEPWFTNFWSSRRQNVISFSDVKVLLYPAYIFRHAEAFARITKSLVFEWQSGEMHGVNPLTGRAEFRFEHRILS